MSEKLEGRISANEAAIEDVRQSIKVVFGKLDAIASVLTELRASSGPAFKDILDIGTRVVVIFGALVGGIVYLARGGNSETLHDLDVRVAKMELRLQWQAKGF